MDVKLDEADYSAVPDVSNSMNTVDPQASERGHFMLLLISLLLLFFIFPVVEGVGRMGVVFSLFFSAILVSAVYAISERKKMAALSLALVVPAIAGRWAANFLESNWLEPVGDAFSAAFLILTATVILSHVLRAERITPQKIYGAVCVYLLIGLIWAFLFAIVEALQPGSFRLAQSVSLNIAHLVYYSFITLTTLGYGDITPVSPPARSLSSLEAIIGQLFLTILVARLVGLHITHSQGKKTE